MGWASGQRRGRRPGWVAPGPGGRGTLFALLFAVVMAGGCGNSAPQALPTIGEPTPSASAPATATPQRAAQLRKKWKLHGADLPNDWPDVPLPRGTSVGSAYAVGSNPRSWTASFSRASGSALDIAKPLARRLAELEYTPVSAYAGPDDSNTGLFSFLGPKYAVYLLLGEVDGRPNVVMTVRDKGRNDQPASSAPATTAAPDTHGAPSGAAPRPAQPTGPAQSAESNTSPSSASTPSAALPSAALPSATRSGPTPAGTVASAAPSRAPATSTP